MRQAEKERKIFQPRIPFILDQGKKISKNIAKKFKKLKNLFPAIFFAKRQIGREREKRNLVPNFVQTRPGQENSEKNSKKIQKIKKPLSSIFFSQNGMRQTKRQRKTILYRIPFILGPRKQILKKIARKFEKLKNLFPAFFLAKTG